MVYSERPHDALKLLRKIAANLSKNYSTPEHLSNASKGLIDVLNELVKKYHSLSCPHPENLLHTGIENQLKSLSNQIEYFFHYFASKYPDRSKSARQISLLKGKENENHN